MTISVVTPSFNQLDWLQFCVASVADQVAFSAGKSEFSVEHIIQDAGTPGIEEFARKLGAEFHRDGRLVFAALPSQSHHRLIIHSEADEGMYDAINRGLQAARGKIAAYLNCDEQYLPGTLALVADWFDRHPLIEVAFGDAIVVDGRGGYICDRKVMVPSEWHTRISGNLSFFTAATFFRTNAIVGRGIAFDPSWKAIGDAVWALDLLRHKVRMDVIGRPMATHADTGENLILSPGAVDESRRLFASAPWLVRKAKQILIVWYRVRRALAGAYKISPHSYEIYTAESSRLRQEFEAHNPTHVWPGR